MGKIIIFVRRKNKCSLWLFTYNINYWHLNYFHSLIENKNYKKNNLPEKIYVIENCRNFY